MMPSAASNNTKLEKQVSGTPAESSSDNNNATNPMKQALITIEHKIRNLEKRKTKLESYRAIQASGKELSADQKAAVAKYDAVTQTLEFARDLSKQMVQFSKDAEKEQKKQARKDAIVRAQTETSKIREVLVIQNILTNLSIPEIRDAFLSGENGALKLEPADLENLEKFHSDIQAKRPGQTDDVPFLNLAQKAAEYLSMTIDGRPKQYGETTFENLKRICQQIQESGYLDKIHFINQPGVAEEQNAIVDEANEGEQQDEQIEINDEVAEEDEVIDENSENQQQEEPHQMVQNAPIYTANPAVVNNVFVMESTEVPPVYAAAQVHNHMQTTPPPSGIVPNQQQQQPPQQHHQQQQHQQHAQLQQQQQQQQQSQQHSRQVVPSPVNMQQAAVMPQVVAGAVAAVPGHFPATTVRAVEEAYFKQQQYLQQMRPLAEVIGGGNFFFLQDSELDSPEVGGVAVAPTGYTNSIEVQTQCTNVFNQHPSQQPSAHQHQQQQQQQQQQPQQPQQQHQMQIIQQSQASQQQSQAQQQPQQQQQQQHLSKTTHVNIAAPIPTQTFTNQSFPPLVQAPTALYPVPANSVAASLQSPLSHVPGDNKQQQLPQAVFPQGVNANPAILSVQHQMIGATSGHQQPQIDQQQQSAGAAVVMMNRLPLAGFQQFESNSVAAPQTTQKLNPTPTLQQQGGDPYGEQIEAIKEDVAALTTADEVNQASPTSDWETPTDRDDRRRDNSQSKKVESNQWSSEMNSATLFSTSTGTGGGNQSDSSSNANSNSRKNDWNDDNHHQGRHESNHWSNSNHQNDSYGGGRPRHNNYNRNDQRGRDGGGGRSNMDRMDRGNMRGGNNGGPGGMGGGYRGRSNYSSQSQQNGGRQNSVYFRDNGYYQNGNSNNGNGGNNNSNSGGGGGYNKDGGGNNQRYDNSNNYRSRAGNNNNNNGNNTNANNRNNTGSSNGGGTRSSMSSMSGGTGGGGGINGPRTGGGNRPSGASSGGSSYVNSRQPNPRQQQDVA